MGKYTNGGDIVLKNLHPYIKYGLALTLLNNNKSEINEISHKMLENELINSLNHFRLEPINYIEGNPTTQFSYISYNILIHNDKLIQSAGLSQQGKYLAPNIISTDKDCKKTFLKIEEFINLLKKSTNLGKSEVINMSIAPITSKINSGKNSQSAPSATLFEAICCAITNSTPFKPCILFKIILNKKITLLPTTIIPDLPINELKDFIELFKRMLLSIVNKDLLQSKFNIEKNQFRRPNIFFGNFPYSARMYSLSAINLIASIGKWSEVANQTEWAIKVLESLKKSQLYVVNYNKVYSVSYNHHIIELAKSSKLSDIIFSMNKVKIYSEEKKWDSRGDKTPNYKLFEFYFDRFLQLYDQSSFKDFLSIRSEYDKEIKTLFINYFKIIMNIPIEVINSADSLGKWLNQIAYFTAKNESENKSVKDSNSGYKTDDEITKMKAKILVELESSAFSAKDASSLIFQVITRAGRLSGRDAPEDSKLFIEKTLVGEIDLNTAKQLIISFSRIKSSKNKYKNEDEIIEFEEDETIENLDYSDAQE